MRTVCCQRPHDEGQCWDCPLRSDGGPAFPRALSLRDYFAAAAIPDVLRSFNWTESQINSGVEMCYRLADAMLAERERKP